MKRFLTRFGMPALFVLGLSIGVTGGIAIGQSYQPHMQNALNYLRDARTELNNAATNKNGHRANALNYVGSAITEVKDGIIAAGGTPQ